MTDKSCSTCPAFVPPETVDAEFRGNLGGGFCGRYGHVLGKPGLSDPAVETLLREFAAGCDAHGLPWAHGPGEVPKAVVSSADVQVTLERSTPGFEPERLGSCVGCSRYVDADAVRDEFGWPLPMCAGQGKLIFPSRLTREPRACGMAKAGPHRDSTDGLFLDPRYDTAFKFGDGPTVQVVGNDADINADDSNIVDPREYVTDKPVSQHFEDQGVRAWRKVTSPVDPNVFTYMPIFYPEFFPESERHLIPQLGDASHPELYVDHQHLEYELAVTFMENDETPALAGHAGVGKTELWNYGSWRCQMPRRILSMTSSTEIDDLVGKWLFRDNETTFSWGRLALGYTRPGWLLVDEGRVASEEVWELLRPMTDDRKYLPLDAAEGEVLHKHDWCFFGTADNFSWDPRYVGVKEISEADRDRLTHIMVDLPPEHLERKMLLRRMRNLYSWEPTPEVMDKVMAVATTLRDMGKMGNLSITWGMRPQFKVLKNLRWFDVERSYSRAMLNDLDPATINQVLDVVRDHF